MLYRTNLISENEKNDFIFEADVKNDDINMDDVAILEAFYKKNGYIPNDKISLFLDWLTYNSRTLICSDFESPFYSSFSYRCGTSQAINNEVLNRIGLSHKNFNVSEFLGTDSVHALCSVVIPTKINKKIVNKEYVLDPTFRQFCLRSECSIDCFYKNREKTNVGRNCPYPGYFLKINPDGESFSKELIRNGYFELTSSNLKIYLDSFMMFIKDKDSYYDSRMIGKIYSTNISGDDYIDMYNKIVTDKHVLSPSRKVITPLESYLERESKIINRIKNKLNKKKSIDVMLNELYEEDNNIDKSIVI